MLYIIGVGRFSTFSPYMKVGVIMKNESKLISSQSFSNKVFDYLKESVIKDNLSRFVDVFESELIDKFTYLELVSIDKLFDTFVSSDSDPETIYRFIMFIIEVMISRGENNE